MNRTIRLLAILIGAILLTTTLALAQETTQGTTSTPANSNPRKTKNVRARRSGVKSRKAVAAPKAEQSPTVETKTETSHEDKTTASSPEVNEPSAKPKESPADQSEQRDDSNGLKEEPASVDPAITDPITALREQIEAAQNPVEQSRLRMQLVDKLIADGKQADAINELRAISFQDHFDPQGLYNAGNALARLGDTDGAIAAYHKAIEQRKGRYTRALNNLGVLLLRQGRWDEAYQALVSALRFENFRYAEASYNLGRLYLARGEDDLAAREWRRALTVNPEHKAAAQALAAMGQLGRINVVGADNEPEFKDRGTRRAIKNESTDSTDRPFKVARANPSSGNSLVVDSETFDYLQRARMSRDRDRQADAVANYRKVLSRMGGYFPPANLELSYSLINLKRSDEAIEVLAPITMRDGQRYPISYYHLARLYEARGDLNLAEENFNRAATYYRKDNAQFLLDVSRVREKLGDYEGALRVFEEYLATIEQKNQRPNWSTERLTSLRQRIAAAGTKP